MPDGRITGTSGQDVLIGDGLNNVIRGLRGHDELQGLGGNDRLYGNSGNDRLDGGTGDDLLDGGKGTDIAIYSQSNAVVVNLIDGTASGADGKDILVSIEDILGSAFDDIIIGNDAANSLSGGNGDDRISGNAGHDRLFGMDGDDKLIGGDGNDYLDGGDGADSIVGGQGNDLIRGGAGDDVISGGHGDDRIFAGVGSDVLTGGKGRDVFYFDDGSLDGAIDIITDFSHAQGDRINLRGIDANIGADGDQRFAFIGGEAFHGVAGELRFDTLGDTTVLFADRDGDGVADFSLVVQGSAELVQGDIVL